MVVRQIAQQGDDALIFCRPMPRAAHPEQQISAACDNMAISSWRCSPFRHLPGDRSPRSAMPATLSARSTGARLRRFVGAIEQSPHGCLAALAAKAQFSRTLNFEKMLVS